MNTKNIAENNSGHRSPVTGHQCLITGITGFLGNEIALAWRDKDIEVFGLSRSGADIECDLSREIPVVDKSYDVVVHAAGLAHVEASNAEFYNVNFHGTDRLLAGLEKHLPRRLVLISSVAVYGLESGEMIDEQTPCNPTTAYGKSKLLAEEAVQNWSEHTGVPVLILRLPLVNGENPPGNLGAMREAMKSGRYFRIGKGNARKSWVQAHEVAEFIWNNPKLTGVHHLTSSHHPTLAEIENQIAHELNLPKPKSIPYALAWIVAQTFGRIPGFPLSLARFRKLTAELTFRSPVTGHR